jgi:arsenate reductase (glutaredoxin)
VNYVTDPLGEEKLRELIRKMGIAPRELLRTGEAVYKELDLGSRELSDDEIIRLMAEHPDLIQRPIVERGERAVLGRPTERIKELL